jgi:hypothetical protein
MARRSESVSTLESHYRSYFAKRQIHDPYAEQLEECLSRSPTPQAVKGSVRRVRYCASVHSTVVIHQFPSVENMVICRKKNKIQL